jgi:hypothetical protein
MNIQNQAANDKGSASNNHIADSKGSSTAEVNTYRSLKSKPKKKKTFFFALTNVEVKKKVC